MVCRCGCPENFHTVSMSGRDGLGCRCHIRCQGFDPITTPTKEKKTYIDKDGYVRQHLPRVAAKGPR